MRQLYHKPTWVRLPEIVRFWSMTQPTTTIASAFGGLIVSAPAGHAGCSQRRPEGCSRWGSINSASPPSTRAGLQSECLAPLQSVGRDSSGRGDPTRTPELPDRFL